MEEIIMKKKMAMLLMVSMTLCGVLTGCGGSGFGNGC